MSFIVFSIIIFFISLEQRQAISWGPHQKHQRGGGEKTVASYIWKLGNPFHCVPFPGPNAEAAAFTAGFQHIDFVIFFLMEEKYTVYSIYHRAGVPNLWDLVPDDLRWN